MQSAQFHSGIFSILIISIVLLSACECNRDFNLDRDFSIWIKFVDTRGDEAIFKRDSIVFYDLELNQIPNHDYSVGYYYFAPYWHISHLDPIPLNQEVADRFYIDFKSGFSDLDTLDIIYDTRLDKCDFKSFKYMKIMYNNEIIFDEIKPRSLIYLDVLYDSK